MVVLKVNRLSAFYGKAKALSNISFSVNEGETIAIVGANGAGKSTLFDSIMGLAKSTGDIQLWGEDISNFKPAEIVQRGVGYAPERFNLFPHMTVRDNLLIGAFTARNDVESNLRIVHQLFPRLREREAQETSTQSGGERQMVSLGRALMTSPRLLLIDEPTIGLAPKICAEIAEILRKLSSEMGITVLIAEQNANFALSLAQRLYVLESGEISVEGTTEELSSDEKLTRSYFGN